MFSQTFTIFSEYVNTVFTAVSYGNIPFRIYRNSKKTADLFS